MPGHPASSVASTAGLASATPVRVLHFVTGGFSGGATQVAIALTRAALAGGRVEPLLVLRRKLGVDPMRIEELRESGVRVLTVPRWPRIATVLSLAAICRTFQPDVLVAHGYSDHLWGRYAGLLAGVKSLVHVEHNTRERYTRWRLAQSRWLARRSARIVGCSEAVRTALLNMGLPAEKTIAISNGIRLTPFERADDHPLSQRTAGIVMVARFSRQKDHATLLRAIALLGERGLHPPLLLAGGGKAAYRENMESLAGQLGLTAQVRFLGVCPNVPDLLLGHTIAVLSTHYEGMPLALLEGMAAGCAVVASDVEGVREILRDGENGLLVAEADPVALADALELLLTNPQHATRLAAMARAEAIAHYGLERMNERYEKLFLRLARANRFLHPKSGRLLHTH
ncbi:MAG: glycosyltransferase [Dokdonella sp.]